jgi:hypothetical protein
MKFDRILKRHANAVTLSLVAVLLPLPVPYSLFSIWLLVAWWLIRLVVLCDIKIDKERTPYILLFASPLILLAISLTYSSQPDLGFGLIERSVPFLVFPVIMGALNPSYSVRKVVLGSFTVSILVVSLACVGIGLFNLITDESTGLGLMNSNNFDRVETKWNYVSYIQLLAPLRLHPNFFTLFASVSVFHLFMLLSEGATVRQRQLYLSSLVFLIVVIVLAGARMGILTLLCTACVWFVYNSRKVPRLTAVGLAVGVVVVAAIIMLNPFLKKRFDISGAMAFPKDISGWNAVNIRLALWKCSWEGIRAYPLFGVGSGGNKALGNGCHAKYSFYNVFGQNLNCHNQYLEYQLIGGLPLSLTFLGGLFVSFRIGWKRNDKLYMTFIFIFALNCLTASMLSVFHGIVFFSFFNALFLFETHDS